MVEASPSLRLHVISDTSAVMTRQFHAPRDLVFQAMVEAEHLEQWWGPGGHRATVLEWDVRVGGHWRFVTTNGDGRLHPFRGEYLEIVPPTRLVQTFIYDVEPFTEAESIEAMTLEEFGDRTTMTVVVRYETPELLDVVLESGLEQGASESYERLAAYLEELRSAS